MAKGEFPAKIGRLTKKPLAGERGNGPDTVYWLNNRDRVSKKYYPLRNTEFTIRPMAKTTYRILIGIQRFEEAYTAVEAPITLERAFDHECIRTGIDTASARFKASSEDPIVDSQRRRG